MLPPIQKKNKLPPLGQLQSLPNPEIKLKDNKQPTQQETSGMYTCLGILACFGGLCIHIVIGSLYQWGIINIYITSYYKILDPSVTLQSNAIAFPLMFMSIGLTMRLGLFLAQKTHPLIILAMNQTLCAVSILASSFMDDVILFILFYGIIFGLIAGMSFMVPIVECNKYLPGKKMYVNGVILIGTGMGSVVFGLFSYNYLNPEKVAPSNGYYIGSDQLQAIVKEVPTLLKYLALLYFCIGMMGMCMLAPACIKNRKVQNEQRQAQQRMQASGDQVGQTNQAGQQSNVNNRQILILQGEAQRRPQPQRQIIVNPYQAQTLKQGFCSLVCWIQAFILILGSCGCLLINGNYKTYVKATITDDQFLTIIGVVGSVGNGCTRFFWNLLFSKTGYKTVTLLNIFIMIVVYSTIRFTVDVKQGYLIEVFLANSCIGGYLVTAPTMTQALFGQETGSNIYGFYWEMFALANFIQYGYVQGISTTEQGFDTVIYICLGMSILAIPIIMLTTFQGPWNNDTSSLEYCIGYEKEKNQRERERERQLNAEERNEQNLMVEETLQQIEVKQSVPKEVGKGNQIAPQH